MVSDAGVAQRTFQEGELVFALSIKGRWWKARVKHHAIVQHEVIVSWVPECTYADETLAECYVVSALFCDGISKGFDGPFQHEEEVLK